MNKALFIKDGTAQEITAESILSRKEYLEKYRGHLFCPHPNCPAQLSFAETPTFKRKKIFKTSKNNVHSDDCPHKITYDTIGKRYFSSEMINHTLSDRHKRDILKKLFYRNLDTVESPTNSSPAHKKESKPTNTDSTGIYKSVASIDPNAIPVQKGMREPTVKKRRCSDILSEDIGKLLALDDYAKNAVISEDYVEIILESNTTLLFYNAFRNSSPSAFSLIKNLAKDFITNKHDLLICFIGNVEKKEKGYQIQIMDPSLISFNDSSIYNYKTTA